MEFLSTGKIPSNEHNEDDGLTVFNKLLAQVQDTAVKPHAIINNAPTEQDILANLLGKQMKIDAQQSLPNNAGMCLLIKMLVSLLIISRLFRSSSSAPARCTFQILTTTAQQSNASRLISAK